jgi:hypothetical protein
MVDPLHELPPVNCCLLGAPLFWNWTAWFVTLPVAAAIGLALLLTVGVSANAGPTERRQKER